MEQRRVTINYFIDTGDKEDFYTLWKETEIDMIPRDDNGNIIQEGRGTNRFGQPMDYFYHCKYQRNLSKTKEGTIEKIKELIRDESGKYPNLESIFNDKNELFDLRHNTKPSLEAFGARLAYKNGKWYAKSTDAFFDAWRSNKKEMKEAGWSCWYYEGNKYLRIKPCWYMGFKEPEVETIN